MGRKSIDLSEPSKKYEMGQHIHAINFPYLLVVHPEKGVWILKSKKDATIILKKEDASVKSCTNRFEMLVIKIRHQHRTSRYAAYDMRFSDMLYC